ncbi:MAG: FAD-dependent oxidoreductase [Ruminococcaceae bacterium]|nr:FAD-dependent oxidoreductase [Oscillospiraceae bacterium]
MENCENREACEKRLWSHTANIPQYKQLHGDAKTDVLIIGGGAVGLLCGYFLKNRNVDHMILEGRRILSGTTGLTTAKITPQHGLIYREMIKNIGYERAKLYFEANRRGAEDYRELSKIYPCDFEEKDSFVYLMKGKYKGQDSREVLEREAEAVRKLGFPASVEDNLPLPFEPAGAVRFPNQAQFNPVKFFSQLAEDLNIYENTFVRDILSDCVKTDSGTVKAKKIIVATHFPILNKQGAYYMKMYQSRSYVIALENAQNVEGMYVDGEENGLSFRNYEDLLLIGGGGHRTGKKGGNWEELRRFAQKYYPDSREKCHWAAQDCMSLDKIPYIGLYSGMAKDLYVASGFNKWGMTSSMAAARILSDMVMGTSNRYAEVFSPSRNMIKPQLFVNLGETTVNLIGFSKKRCSHLGCRLKWNRAEHTWDCPCHGSRFSEGGELLDNPANRNL